MAYINVDEVYILDNTGAQVDAVTDIPFKADAGLTDAQKAQARQNLGISAGGGGGGRNLLDNPWFTINQRDVAVGVIVNQNNYIADRWVATGSAGAQRNADGTITNNATVYQKLSVTIPVGTEVTFSALLADGTVEAWTDTFDGASTKTMTLPSFGTSRFYMAATPPQINLGACATAIKAFKLEIGTVSTLANDTAPDYGEELAKCMRYFIRLNAPAWGCNFGIGRATNATTCSVFVPLPVPLRASPTVSVNGIGELQLIGNGGGGNASACSYAGRSESGVNLSFTASGLTTSHLYTLVRNGSTSCYIDLSADL